MQVKSKLVYWVNRAQKTMSDTEVTMLLTDCETERTQFLTVLALSFKNPQLASFLLTLNHIIFLKTEKVTAWFYCCPHHICRLHNSDKCFDNILVQFRHTAKNTHSIARKTFATHLFWMHKQHSKKLVNIVFDTQTCWKLCSTTI